MPPYSSIRTFIDALSSGETNITRCFEKVTNDSAKRQAHAQALAGVGVLNGPHLPSWLQNELIQSGMKQVELDHIERWPDSQKEVARVQVVAALTESRPIHFGWELYDGADPLCEVRRDANQDVSVVFRSPRIGLKLVSSVNLGEVTVEV